MEGIRWNIYIYLIFKGFPTKVIEETFFYEYLMVFMDTIYYYYT